jgi:AraC-like DNA-binding protein
MQNLTELQALIARLAGGTMGNAVLSGIAVAATSVTSVPIHGMYEPVFAILAQGAKRIGLGDAAFDCGAGDYIVMPLDLPVTSNVTEASVAKPYLAAVMALRPAVVATLLLEAGSVERGSDEAAAIRVSRAPAELVDAFARLLRLAEQPSDVAIMQPMIEREIVWRLLCGEQGRLVRQIGLADSRLSKIGHAIRWIRENYASSFLIEELAERVAMSPTSFHRHFRAATAMSPLQYQKQIRLQMARARLVSSSEDIASVGFSVGYESPSQFTREYARLFGAPPSRDTFHGSRVAAVPML